MVHYGYSHHDCSICFDENIWYRESLKKVHIYCFDGIETKILTLVINLEPMRDSLNPQGDKLESTRKKFKKNSAILLIIIYEKMFTNLEAYLRAA